MKNKFFTAVASVFFCCILWAIHIANTGESNILFKLVLSIPHGDKLGHFTLFGVLCLLLNIALNYKVVNVMRVRCYLGSVLVSVFVVAEELSQGLIPTRTLDSKDLLADGLGIAFFSYVTWLLAQRSLKRGRVNE
ncbi:VanZ family protein [Psychrobium sp. 1_MG-2023]|uniref:VanZ family protein n=1 Tax=Psychrobium sp. 1_MG-2023 TaxID=3062624 RepID=UPI000C331CA8|nr:VanZ family protein [Psychrobium sp. 1_MG-2023]MDP2559777.1 VanZ family protein [Psychrobium sp. 1_MG-2023]PKF59115.1 trypsin [Alteromonadales bacterium alter-6D02]